jgi:hypothetical protein
MKTNTVAYFSTIIALCLLAASCETPNDTVAFIDPVFAYVVPSTPKLLARIVDKVIVLPENGTSAALYAALDETSSPVVLLSPLLATEIDAILSMDDARAVLTFGEESRPAAPRLFQAAFSKKDAANLAGKAAALESRHNKTGTKTVGLFAGASEKDLRESAAAFSEGFFANGGTIDPMLEIVMDDFSQSTAQKLASMDIQIAYVSAPPDTIERWIREAFDPYSYIVAEMPLPSEKQRTLADELVVWDIASTARLLLKAAERGNNVPEAGIWRMLRIETRRRKSSY